MFRMIPQSHYARSRGYGKVDEFEDVKYLADQLDAAERRLGRAFLQFVSRAKSTEFDRRFSEFYRFGDVPSIIELVDAPFEVFTRMIETVFIQAGNDATEEFIDEFDVNFVRKVDVDPSVDISFNPGNEAAAAAIRQAQLDAIREILDEQKEAIRRALDSALQQGLGPVAASQQFKNSIGLTQYQSSIVDSFERKLRSLDSRALDHALRDRRFDRSIQNAIRRQRRLAEEQIKRMVDKYRARFIARRAETIARTESLRVVNAARHTSMIQMADKVGMEMKRIQRVWRATNDMRTRHTHRLMNNQVRGANAKFRSPSGALLMFPGDRTAPAAEVINCRCILQIKFKPPQAVETPIPAPPRPAIPTGGAAQPPLLPSGFTYEQQIFRAAWVDTHESLSLMLADDLPSGKKWFKSGPAKKAFDDLMNDSRAVVQAIDAGDRIKAVNSVYRGLRSADELEILQPDAKARLFTQWMRSAAGRHNLYRPDASYQFDQALANARYIEYLESRGKRTASQIRNSYNKKLEDLASAADVYVRVPDDATVLDKILADGRLKSQFESGSSRGLLGAEYRSEAEEILFSLPQDAAAWRRPIYGYITSDGNGAGRFLNGYGNIAFKLKPNKRHYTMITGSDSLGRVFKPSQINAPSYNSVDVQRLRGAKTIEDVGHPYFEAQIGGGINLADDVAEVIFYVDELYPDTYDLYNKYKAAFERLGISTRAIEIQRL